MPRRRRNARRKPKSENDQEDRLSSLPDALLHRIHSKLDIVYAVQASRFSSRWRNLWKTLTHVNFDRRHFQRIADFHKYVFEFLSHRNRSADLSVVSLRSDYGAIQWPLLAKVARYAAAHNVQSFRVCANLTRRQPCTRCGGVIPLPASVFSCDSLKELNLRARNLRLTNLRESCWILPSLTTLVLTNVSFEFCCDEHSTKYVNLFSRLVNLKNLTLIACSTDGLIKFKIINCPALEHLVIQNRFMTELCEIVVSAPKLLSFSYTGREGAPLSTSNLHCLEDVCIELEGFDCMTATHAQRLIAGQKMFKMLKQLQAAKFVVVSKYVIELLCLIFDTVEDQACPLTNLNHLTIDGPGYCNINPDLFDDVVSYLCCSSPNATADVDGELREFGDES